MSNAESLFCAFVSISSLPLRGAANRSTNACAVLVKILQNTANVEVHGFWFYLGASVLVLNMLFA
jgi:hypothetical protein